MKNKVLFSTLFIATLVIPNIFTMGNNDDDNNNDNDEHNSAPARTQQIDYDADIAAQLQAEENGQWPMSTNSTSSSTASSSARQDNPKKRKTEAPADDSATEEDKHDAKKQKRELFSSAPNDENNQKFKLLSLPDELIDASINFLDTETLSQLRYVSRQLNDMVRGYQEDAIFIRHLSIKGKHFLSGKFSQMIRSFRKNPTQSNSFTTASFDGCHFDNIQELHEFITRYCSRLTSLNLSGCHEITNTELQLIAANCHELTHFSIQGAGALITNENIQGLLNNLTHLSHFDFSLHEETPDNTLNAIIEKIRNYCPNIIHLGIFNHFQQPLISCASMDGDANRVDLLLKSGANPNIIDNDGVAPIHHASYGGNVAVVELLLKSGANPNAQDNDGIAPIHYASYGGNVAVVELLLKSGANPNAQDKEGCWSIHYAARGGHVAVVELLLKTGANPNAKNQKGDTPLHSAALNGNLAVVELLLKSEVNFADVVNVLGQTALQLAELNGHTGVVKLLNAAWNICIIS